ncbi:hypothetical protein [Nostoc sp. UHCC 0870]|uniref:hypothetical protein n=1 Tax=Nostoc sp. UHCC 0870 TaxID=2914041 RepID=UPI001EDF83FD|nr:hypothetical protein [Nostoc sp. UHCC 0870]UKO99350.1 hypothetical protein L6494_06455 [Nostoc sp. UHCC 0870]
MSKIALNNGQYANLIVAADEDTGGMFPLPNGRYAQTVLPVDIDGNPIVSTATNTIFTPTGNIAATNVQAAIQELDNETVKTTGSQSINGIKTFNNRLLIEDTTESGNYTNGSFVSKGGISSYRSITAGATIRTGHTFAFTASSGGVSIIRQFAANTAITVDFSGASAAATFYPSGGVHIGASPSDPGASNLRVSGTTPATSTTTGCATFVGGIGVTGDGWFGGTVNAPFINASNRFIGDILVGRSVSGTNIAATNLQIRPGQSTGNVTPSSITFSTTDVGSSGTSFQNITEKMRLSGLGNLLIGTTTDNGNKLRVAGTAEATQYRLSALNTAPASATDTGTLGEIRIDADYIYVCVANNVWKRSALTTW